MAADAVESLTFEALAEDPVALDADSAAATPSLFALDVALFSEPGAVEVAAFSASALVPPDATDGKTSISFRDEPFANFAGGFGNVRYVKGHILLSDPNTVYFQDSVKYLYHYDFAAARLDPFLNMTRDQFDAVSLRRAGQQVVMVSVLMSPDRQELAVQFVGADAYPREDVAAWMRTVAAAVQSDSPPALLYMPTYEQSAAAQADLAWFASQQITVTDASRWMRGDVTYAEGWATGRLVRVPAAEIPAAYGDGRLRPTDILLLTDGVPAEVPFVRGIVTLTPATPNSHVAILARNQEIPFVWVQDAAERQRVAALEGKSVLLRADQGRIAVSPLDTPLEPSSVADWLTAQQTPAPANIVPRAPYGQWLEDATDLTPAEIRYFGGKASNYGLLRRTIPDNSQRAMAFSFDLWDAFMTNVNPATGRTLREEIDLRLGSFSYPPDMTLARQKLAEVNTLIRKTVKWTDAQRSQILAELIAGFPDVPHDKFLRFRSSSNAEDSQELTGAGLYDSFSGCIADDTDNDTKGPSRADPNEPDEKGVFRAIEKVFASFYNENAWLERLRHSVREQDTGMAILVHQNFPDALEMANGVVTFKYQRSQFGDQQEVNYSASIVTQLGALSVTNPEGGAIAEEVAAFFSPGLDPYLYVRTPSTLVPLGTTVMDWQNDYPELMRLIAQVAEGYADLYPQKDEFTLDLEFKRMIPGKLIVKQVREIPTHEIEMVAPQLINENTEWRVLQSEFSDVWAHHRLKSQLSLSTINGPMASGTNPLKSIDLSLLDGTGLGAQPLELEGAPSALPGYSFTSGEGNFVNSFRLGSGAAARDVQLTTNYPALVDKNAAPVITSRDFTQQLEVRYTTPVPWTTPAGPAARYVDQVQLVPAEQLAPADELQTRSWTFGDVTITTRFHYARVGDAMLIKTLPLGSWVDTEIKGLTTEPIRLTSDYSQTYGPGHHNFNEQFLFEPGLDASLTPTQRAELAAKNVRMLHVYFDRLAEGMPGSRTQNLTIFGLDGASRAGSTLTLPDVTLNVGRSVSLVARGADMNGDSIVFRDATWETTGGGTIVRQGARSVFTAQQAGVFELTATDPQHPGIVARARVLVTGVTLDNDATLRVVGGSGNDQVTIEQVGDSELRVRVNFLTGARRVQSFPLEQIVRVEVYGGAGRDVVNASNVSLPVTIEGGAGDDVLRGGAGDDLLFGGIGDDRIWGGLGDDILAGGAGLDTLRGDDGRNLVIGGAGRDQLVGGNTGEDILIGGNTAFSDPAAGFGVDILALRSLLDEWKSAHDSAARKSNLLSGDGGEDRLNDDYFLILGVTVFNDGQRDSIVRGNRRNWKW